MLLICSLPFYLCTKLWSEIPHLKVLQSLNAPRNIISPYNDFSQARCFPDDHHIGYEAIEEGDTIQSRQLMPTCACSLDTNITFVHPRGVPFFIMLNRQSRPNLVSGCHDLHTTKLRTATCVVNKLHIGNR